MRVRDGAWVAELAGDLLDGWPKGYAVNSPQGTATSRGPVENRGRGRHAEHLFRHQYSRPADGRTRAPSTAAGLRQDRIRAARSTGLRNLPPHDTAQNQVWLETVQLALDLLASIASLP